MKDIDYYETLGLERTATAAQITGAYRQLARQFHPDRNKGPDSEERFKLIGQAYQVLKDDETRRMYDRYGAGRQTAQQGVPHGDEYHSQTAQGHDWRGPGAGIHGFSRFWDNLFRYGPDPSVATDRQAFSGEEAGQSGLDREATLALSLEEAMCGGRRELWLQDEARGAPRKISVDLPPGVQPGRRIRLAGLGGRGLPSRPDGDLYLRVEIRPHPRFQVDGIHLNTRLDVMPWTAVLGGTAILKTPEGEVRVKVPPESPSGVRIRLRGRGLSTSSGKRGDLFAELRIVLPHQLTPAQRALFQQLAALPAEPAAAAKP
jgi:curved DNA-binding protein